MTDLLPGEANAKADVDSGEYEKVRKIIPGDKVLDLGAHVGYFSQLACSKVGPTGFVIAFEPHPVNYARLCERMKDCRNFLPFRQAASDHDDAVEIWNNPLNSGAHSLFRQDQHDTSFQVDCVDIGEFLKMAGFFPSLVKIDTEGSEAAIIRSILREGFRPFITVECHDESLYRVCKQMLVDHSYRFTPDKPHVGVCHAQP